MQASINKLALFWVVGESKESLGLQDHDATASMSAL
jgi:hypothetical protein